MNPATTGATATMTTGGNVDIIGPASLEPGTGASKAGPFKTVAVNLTGAIKRVF
jgi:hypothetical protein